MSFAWNDPDYVDLAVAAELLVRQGAHENSGLTATNSTGRAVQAMIADSHDNYKGVLEKLPQIMRDNSPEMGRLILTNKLINREKGLTNSASIGPGMEFHHWVPNSAVHNETKYLRPDALAFAHNELRRNVIYPGTNDFSGVNLSRWGHREGLGNAHINPETGGTWTNYWGTFPTPLSAKTIRSDGDEFIKASIQDFIKHKAHPSIRMALEVYDREAPIRQMFEELVGPAIDFESPRQHKNALKQAGVTDEMVQKLAQERAGTRKPVGTHKGKILTPSWKGIMRPGAEESLKRALKI